MDVLRASDFKRLACDCPHCQGRTDAGIGKRAKEHFLHLRAKEVDQLNALPEGERLASFLKRAERAYKLTAEVRSKVGVQAPAQHFKTWAEVFPEVAKRGNTPTRTM